MRNTGTLSLLIYYLVVTEPAPVVTRAGKPQGCIKMIESINSSKVESAANTLTLDKQEVPNSSGAKEVYLLRAEVDVSAPDYVAASNTHTTGSLVLGDLVPTTPELDQKGAITTKSISILSTGAAGFAAIVSGPGQAQGRWKIPKSPIDKKYYVTGAIKGTLNTAAKTLSYRADFEVLR